MRGKRAFGTSLALALLLLFLPSGARSAADWPQAIEPREWSFPRDHGAHPEYATEWWYFTGNVRAEDGRGFGYQFTVFRVALRRDNPLPENRWSLRDVYLAHFALSDVAGKRFFYFDKAARPGPGLAGASTTEMDVWVLDWGARMEGDTIRVRADAGEAAIDLLLTPRKPLVLHGEGGLSRKGPRPGQASYYASFTNLDTTGSVRVAAESSASVTGTSWFDQEFGSNQLAADQEGWDWFSLHLSDGRDLMLYVLRRKDGTVEPASSGTLVEPDGRARHLPLAAFQVEVSDHWRSPRSDGRYPSRWRLVVLGGEMELTLEPLLADQELVTEGTTGVVYWEGAVSGQGTSAGGAVECKGYVEMTGYAGALGGLF